MTLALSFAAFADGSGPILSVPVTGAFDADFIEDRDHVTIMNFAGNYNRDLAPGVGNVEPRAVIAREFFRTHPDEYDFLVVFSTFEFQSGDAVAFHWGVQNDVAGINLQNFNVSQAFGSAGKLKGFIDMAAMSRYKLDPADPEFERPLGVLAHEVLHQWASRVRFRDANGQLSDALLGKDNSHWSYLLDSDASVQYGSDWRDNGNGTFTSVGTRKFYSPLDLYLMGLYRADEVPPFYIIENPAISKVQLPLENQTISGTRRNVTIQDVIAAEGPRIPSVENSQKEFRMGFIIIKGANEQITDAQLLAVNNVRTAFMTRFSIMTGGRAVLHAFPAARPTEVVGTPGVITGEGPIASQVDLTQALTWLRNRQELDGRWVDREATAVRDTTIALGALAKLDAQFVRSTDALQWLSGQSVPSTDSVARRSRVIADLGGTSTTLNTQLLEMQNADGGWGAAQGYRSNPLDTALALNALAGSSAPATAVDRAAQYLISKQNTDGGWAATEGGPSRTTPTSLVLRALRSANRHSSVATAGLGWLASKQNGDDDGFGDSPSTVHDTANALLAFMAFDALGSIRSADASDYIRSRQTAAGSWDGSVYTTASAVSVLRAFNAINLTASTLTALPAAPLDGDRVQLSFQVRNDGNLPSTATVVRVYDGNPDSGGVQIGADIPVPVLTPNASVTFSPTWDSFGRGGAHTLYAVVDPLNTVSESTELDNRATIALTVAAAPAGIDLSFGTPDVVAMPAQPNTLPSTVGVSLQVRNLGQTDANNVLVRLMKGTELVASQTIDLQARTTQAVNFTYAVVVAGQVSLTAQLDPSNTVAEVNESNNSRVLQIATAPSVDLQVEAQDICVKLTSETQAPCVATGNALVGADVAFTVKLRNRGTTDSTSTLVRYFVTDGSTTQEITSNNLQLNAGQETTQTIPWRVNLTGSLTFTVQLDPAGLLPELSEDNNVASLSFNGGNATGPNLVVHFADFTANPDPGREGHPVLLSALVRNTGTLPASDVLVHFYNGDPAAGGTLIGTSTLSTVNAGATGTATFSWSAIPDTSDKLLFAVVDPNNAITEFAENDNSAFIVLTVLSLPDLAVSPGDVVLTPAFPRAGESVGIAVRVANLGAQSAANVQVRLYDGDPASGGTPIGTLQNITSIAGFAAGTASFSWSPTGALGGRAIYAVVDPSSSILERTRTNNTARRDFSIQDADLFVTERYFSPDGDGVKDSTSVSFRLQAQSTVTVEVLNPRGRAIRRFSGADLTNVSGGTVTWDGLDSLGRVVADNEYKFRILSPQGLSLGETTVEVDNNRSSLLKAGGTPFESVTNLTCDLTTWITHYDDVTEGLKFTGDDAAIFYATEGYGQPAGSPPEGIWRMAGDGTDVRPIVSAAQINQLPANPMGPVEDYMLEVQRIKTSANGSLLAYERYAASAGYELWVVEGDGKNLRKMQTGQFNLHDLTSDGRYAIGQNTANSLISNVAVSTAGTGTIRSVNDTGGANYLGTTSPNGRFVTQVDTYGGSRAVIHDLVDNVNRPFAVPNIGVYAEFHWSPDSKYVFAYSHGYEGDKPIVFRVFDPQGNLIHTVNSPIIAGSYSRAVETRPAWLSNSQEIAFAMDTRLPSGTGGCEGSCPDAEPIDSLGVDPGGIFVFNVVTGGVERVAEFPAYDGTFTELYPGLGGPITYNRVPTEGIQNHGKLVVIPGERSLVWRNTVANIGPGQPASNIWGVFLDEDNEQRPVFEGSPIEWNKMRFSPSGRQLLFASTRAAQDPTSACYNKGNQDVFSYRSLLNLTADMRAVRSAKAGGIQIRGTASDLNFQSYRLEYAPVASPNSWAPIAPASGEPVIDDLLTTWVPPAPGNYFVRLSVEDQAGNQRRTVRRVSWADTPSITDVYRLPAYISPNGDNVNDSAVIHYRVLEPVHLTFEFFDEAGRRVRSIERDHSTPGVEANLNWDGRADNGTVVANGRYRMVVQNYEFFVTVDATPPQALITARPAYQPLYESSNIDPFAGFEAGYEMLSGDENFLEQKIERGTGADPSDWQSWEPVFKCRRPYPPGPARGEVRTPRVTDAERECEQADSNDFSNARFRLTVRDRAGNTSVATTELGPEQLGMLQFNNHKQQATECAIGTWSISGLCIDQYSALSGVLWSPLTQSDGLPKSGNVDSFTLMDRAPARFMVADTLRTPMTQLFVQFRRVDVADWQESELTEYYRAYFRQDLRVPNHAVLLAYDRPPAGQAVPSGHLRLPVWDMAGVEAGQRYVVRLRAVDGVGVSHFSNATRFETHGLTFHGLVPQRNQIADEDLARLMDTITLKPGERALWGKEFIGPNIRSLKLFLTSSDDPRFATERQVGELFSPDRAFVFTSSQLATCRHYMPRLVAEIENGVDPRTGDPLYKTVELNADEISIPCIDLAARARPVPSESCTAESPKRMRVSLSPIPLDDTALTLLTLSRELPNGGGEDIVFNANRPARDYFIQGNRSYSHHYEIDTSGMAEGTYYYKATVRDEADNVEIISVPVVVDHTPAQVALNYPTEGLRVCGVPRLGADGLMHGTVTFDGAINDANGFHYKLKLRTSPESSVVFHDSRNLDSRSVPATDPRREDYAEKSEVGPLAVLQDRSGDVSVDLEVDDMSGLKQCTNRTFFFDGLVEGPMARIDRGLFSPNGDGNFDEVLITYGIDETSSVTTDIYRAVLDNQLGWQPVGPSVRRLQNNVSVLAGESTIEWDGFGTGGSAVPDDHYIIVFRFRDSCGNIGEARVVTEVDNTPPAVTVAYPRTIDNLPLIVEVQGTVRDLHPLAFRVEYGVGAAPEGWAVVGQGRETGAETIRLGVWNTYGLEAGPHVVRVVAVDTVANERIVAVPVSLVVRSNLINVLEVVPELFSPNADTRRDTAAVRYGLDNTVITTLEIRTLTNVRVRRLIDGQTFQPGPRTASWDGLTDTGQAAPDGEYIVHLEAALASNPLLRQEEKVTITLDRTPPAITVTRPNNGYVQGVGFIMGSIVDSRLTEYEVSLAENPAAPSWQSIQTGELQVVNGPLGDLSELEEGDYAIRITASDAGESESSLVVPFVIDNTKPEVTLTAPENRFVASLRKGVVSITGTVVEANLQSYTLRFGAGTTPTSWTTLATATTVPTAELLSAWNITGLADGLYTVELNAVDRAGLTASARIEVIVDNTPPTVAVTTPTEAGYIKEPSDLLGTAADLNFVDFVVEVAPGARETASQFLEVLGGTAPVTAGSLGRLEALPPDGTHTLRLKARDLGDNTAELLVQVKVDVTPPGAPINLTAAPEERTHIRLNWTANTEPDLAGYHVYRDGNKITNTLVSSPTYLDLNPGEGTYVYEVVAVDQAGWESPRSNSVRVALDLSPPNASISTPANGAVVSGLLDIIGTASSPVDDFKEYRLSVGAGATPSVWQQMRRSPVPMNGEAFTSWNTVILAEGSVHTLRLEAEDINGNIATHQVTVTVDNLPPAAPTGLAVSVTSANVNGSNLQVTWNANTEPDLYGYLLFRDERLANQTGPVIGSLKPYALATTTYPDPLVADGEHSYYLLAIDQAGNISPPSAPFEITLDTRTPRAVIAAPANNATFDTPLYVTATTADTDVASVQFQYRADASATWINLGSDTSVTYETSLDPVALGIPYGLYHLRAIATDLSNRTDTDPPSVAVRYIDLTLPRMTVGVANTVNGGDVTVTWTANTDTDLAGYFVERRVGTGTFTRLTPTSIMATTYLDTNVADGRYEYRVVAVDTSTNQADPSATTEAFVYTPTVKQPYMPTSAATVSFTGAGKVAATVSGTIVNSGGSTPLTPIATGPQFAFAYSNLPLLAGNNVITLRLTDAAGNISKPVIVEMMRGVAPSRPTGVAVNTLGDDANVTWNANPESDIVGYRVFRQSQGAGNYESVIAESRVTGITASTSSGLARNETFTDFGGYWYAYPSDEDVWLQGSWATPRYISAIEIQWINRNSAKDFDIQGRYGNVWVTLAEVRNENPNRESYYTSEIVLAKLYVTNGIRIVVHTGPTLNGEEESAVLYQVRVFEEGTASSTSYTDTTLEDGRYQYAVSALNALGMESERSLPADAGIGDVEPPSPVVLSGTVTVNDVALSWTESGSPDVAAYLIYRDDVLLVEQDAAQPRTYTDVGVTNGTHLYTVSARDGPGNESARSNVFTAVISVAVPAAPTNLVVTTPQVSGALDLAWTPAAGPAPDSYRVFRSNAAAGVYEDVGSTSETTFRDSDLINGQTYWYRVHASDAFGNLSAGSNVASGIPRDLQAPVVEIHYPTVPGRLFVAPSDTTRVFARTEPGATVRLMRGGVTLREVQAATSLTDVPFQTASTAGLPRLSPDGRAAVYDVEASGGTTIRIRDIAGGVETTLANSGYYDPKPTWSADGREIYYIDSSSGRGRVMAVRVSDGVTRVVAAATGRYVQNYSFDDTDSHLIVYDSEEGELAEVDLATGAFRSIEATPFDVAPLLSPDGSHYAKYVYTPDDRVELRLVQVATGATTVVDTNGLNFLVKWSPDGTRLAFPSLRTGLPQPQIFTYEVATATLTQRTFSGIGYRDVHFAPDGRSLAALTYDPDDNSQLDFIDLFDGTTVRGTALPNLEVYEWSRSGHLLAWVGEGYIRINPPGRVEFPSVLLNAGDNVFAATATDAVGNVSQPSRQIVVSRVAEARPDLIVDDASVRVVPVAPLVGESVRISATVRNGGTASAASSALSLMVIAPDGSSTPLNAGTTANALAVQARRTVTVDFAPTRGAGKYSVVALADPADAVVELSESNNFGLAEFNVIAEAGQQLQASTDRDSYSAGETALGTVTLRNFGSPVTGRLTLAIEDAQGFVVRSFADVPISAMPYNGSRTETISWPTGSTFAGAYQLHARLLNDAGTQLAESRALFLITAASNFSASVRADRESYATGENAHIEGTFNYLAGNAPVSGASATLQILDATDTVVAESVQTLGDLLPNSSGQISLDWTSTGTGNYRAALRLTQGATLLTGAQALFSVNAGPAQLAGTITLSEQAPGAGTPQVASWRVNNAAGAGVNQLPIIVSLVSPDSPTPIVTERVTRDIGSGGNSTGLQTYDTAALRLQQYNVLLQVEVAEGSQTRTITLATAAFNVADRTPPTVSVRAPSINGFVPAGASASIFARDTLSSVAEVSYAITEDTWFGATTTVAEESLYGGLLGTLADGDYTIRARATDAFGNTGLSAPVSFVVDNTPPVISITGAQNGSTYTTPVTLSASASDLHLDGVVSLLDGAEYTNGTAISAAGAHRLVVTAVDLAGNRASQTLEFTLNPGGGASPVITVTGVTHGGQYNTDVTPVITVTDADDAATYTATLNGSAYTSGTPVTTDGSYTLVVDAVDAANHTVSLTVTFAVDKTAPGVSVQAPTANAHVRGSLSTTLQASDNSAVAQVSYSIDGGVHQTASSAGGSAYTGPLGSLADGPHTVAGRAIDTFGNVADTAAVPFVVDNTAPVITVTGVVDEGVYGAAVSPAISVTDANLQSSTSLLDGVAYVPGTPITAAGVHQLVVTGTDIAGNVSTTTVDFRINDAVPVITVTGVNEGGQYTATVTPVITVTDADDEATYTATLNGAAYTSGTPVSTDGSYVLVVNATDAASHTATLTVNFAIDRTAPVVVVQAPAANAHLRGVLGTALQATDNVALATVGFSVDGGAFQAATGAGGNLFTGDLGTLADGAHTLTGRATDTFGNVTTTAAVPFVVDNTAPVVTVTGVTEGGQYTAAVSPAFTVTDANLLGSTALLNGVAFASGTAVVAAGTYQLVVTGTDIAGNVTTVTRNFVIGNNAAPVITVTGVVEGGRYNAKVTPVITVTDTDSPTYTATLNGAPFTSGTELADTQAYVLVVNAQDAANNQSSLTVNFSIDRSPPAITATLPVANSVLDSPVAVQFTVTDTNPIVSVQYRATDIGWTDIPLQPSGNYSFTLPALGPDGEKFVQFNATDDHGNVGAINGIPFVLDSTPPVIMVTGASEGGVYSSAVTLAVTITEANPQSQSILLDGAAYVPGTAISALGAHQLVVQATDLVGHTTARELNFTLVPAGAELEFNVLKPFDDSQTNKPYTEAAVITEVGATVIVELNGQQIVVTANADGWADFENIPLLAGQNILTFRGYNAAGAQSPVVTRKVTYESLAMPQLSGQRVEQHATLIYMPALAGSETCRIEGHFGLPVSETGACTEDRYSPLTALAKWYFETKGWSYQFVRNEADFLAALRSQRYDNVLLAELSSAAPGAASLGMSETAWAELKGSVAAGVGLAFIKTNGETSLNPHLRKLFGASVNATDPQLTGITHIEVPDSLASWQGDWNLNGVRGSRLDVTQGGTSVGHLTPSETSAMSIHGFGFGRTALAAFDPADNDENQGAYQLLHGLFSYTAPDMPQQLKEGAVASITWTGTDVSNDGSIARLHVTLPPELRVVETTYGGQIVNDHEVLFELRPDDRNHEFKMRVVMPNATGWYTLQGELFEFIDGMYELQDTATLDIDTSLSRVDAGATTLNVLNAMSVPPGGEGMKTAAVAAVTAAVNRTQTSAATAESSIADLINALGQLMGLSPMPQEEIGYVGDLMQYFQALSSAAGGTGALSITVSGVMDWGQYNGPVTPIINVTGGLNPEYEAWLDGAWYVSGTPVTAQGYHSLVINAENAAGATVSREINFEIGAFTPTLPIDLYKPLDNSGTADSSVRVKGATLPNITVHVKNGAFEETIYSDGNGEFSVWISVIQGVNTIEVHAEDGSGQVSATVTRIVHAELGGIEADADWIQRHSTLVYLPGTSGATDCRIDGSFGAQTGNSGTCTTDRYSALVALLQADFSATGRSYRIVRNEAAFVEGLRDDRFDSVVIGELNSAAAGTALVSLSTNAMRELKTTVAGGVGLAWIKTQGETASNSSLKELFGTIVATSGSQLSNITSVVLPDDIASEAGTWALTAAKAAKLNVNGGGYRTGDLLPGTHPALVLHNFGGGRTAIMAFNPADLNDPSGALSTLHHVLDWTCPDPPVELRAGDTAVLRWRLEGLPTDGRDIRVVVTLPAGVKLVENMVGATIDGQVLTWEFEPTSEDMNLDLRVRFAMNNDNYVVEGDVYREEWTGFELRAEADKYIGTSLTLNGAYNDVITELNAWSPPSGQLSLKTAAINSINAANNRAQASQADALASINDLLSATNSLLGMNPDPMEVLRLTGCLLRFYQGYWLTYVP